MLIGHRVPGPPPAWRSKTARPVAGVGSFVALGSAGRLRPAPTGDPPMIRLTAILSLALAASAQADVTIIAQANGSTSPGVVPATQSLTNGDFIILANPQANVTGDGWDETTIWNFNLAADPNYAAFI